jgi:hypothetical protein
VGGVSFTGGLEHGRQLAAALQRDRTVYISLAAGQRHGTCDEPGGMSQQTTTAQLSQMLK